jgi:hypothetical protein
MRNLGLALGLAGLVSIGSAAAGPAVIFDTLGTSNGVPVNGNLLDNRSFSMKVGGLALAGSPLAEEFNVSSGMTISSVSMRLTDVSALTDGGSILVFLVPDQGGTPMSSGLTLASSKISLGTIADSILPVGLTGCSISQCNTTLNISQYVPAGQYWLALVNGTDTRNGGSVDALASLAAWWTNGNGSGTGTAGESNGHVQALDGTFHIVLDALSTASFEAQVQAPEPTSLALLGAGLAGLGFRLRRKKKSAV